MTQGTIWHAMNVLNPRYTVETIASERKKCLWRIHKWMIWEKRQMHNTTWPALSSFTCEEFQLLPYWLSTDVFVAIITNHTMARLQEEQGQAMGSTSRMDFLTSWYDVRGFFTFGEGFPPWLRKMVPGTTGLGFSATGFIGWASLAGLTAIGNKGTPARKQKHEKAGHILRVAEREQSDDERSRKSREELQLYTDDGK